uniref:Uncharacterized protein n=1 Tax=Arundo donax TaxID=35708 RepID=A0A0A8YNJ7_ARUDO
MSSNRKPVTLGLQLDHIRFR